MTQDLPGSRIPGFYQLNLADRMAELKKNSSLSDQDLAVLQGDAGLSLEQAGHMVENVVGVHALPLGIGLNFLINGKDVLVPMVIEEPSVVAGASFMAKLARAGGGFHARASTPEMIAQMQVLNVPDLLAARAAILAHKQELLDEIAAIDPVLSRLGGGPRDIEVRIFETSPVGPFLVVHLIIDVRDAMGANAVNTAAEMLAPRIETLSGGKVHLRILSNLADRRLASAECTIPVGQLAFGEYSGEEVRDGIIAAWAFATVDPYRAATHNKGIMNGVDAVVMASGNDWRAVEAGAHAYAARNGRYTSLSTWSCNEQGDLCGTLEMPMAVGIVGGATRVHPTAKAALILMNIQTAGQLAEIIVSVGLAQNLAALRALATEGIQRGHMSLHARQLAIAAGAAGEMVESIARQLVDEKNIRLERAEELLKGLS